MRPSRLLVPITVLAVAAVGCGFSVEAGSSSGSSSDAAPPAAGACLQGATDCDDVGGDMGAPPPDGDLPVADDAPAPHQPDPGAPATPAATHVEPRSGLEDVHPVPWDGAHVDPDDPTRVVVRWTSGVAPCHAFAGIEVETTDDTVTLTVREGTVPSDEPQACIEVAQYKQATVELDQEIGPRSIVDGAE